MRILFLTSELCGFAKTGGLADVAKSLPLELARKNHEVIIMLPCYSKIANWNNLPIIAQLTMDNNQNDNKLSFKVRETTIQNLVKVWLIDQEFFFNRNNLYAENNISYEDNGERFAFFSAACLQATMHLGFCPEIVHCNDWHTALAPMILVTKYVNVDFFKNTRSILTIHNGAFQGVFNRSQLWMLPEIARVSNDSIIHGYANLNFLKCGVYYADKINAVSPSYAEELTTFLGGHGITQNFIDRINDLCGIINGCDYSDWDPSIDVSLAFHFDKNNKQNKKLCKYLLQQTTSLPVCDVPVFGMVCRLTDQKGVGLLIPILNDFLKHKVQLIIVGTGDLKLESMLHELANKYPNKFVFKSLYDNVLAHLVEAGADFFLMPSIFEPCGLNQMYSLAYGTLPIVRSVGGLKDTVISYDQNPKDATGFAFTDPDPNALLSCLRRVLIFYLQEYDEFLRLRDNAMNVRYEWSKSAEEYEEMYYSALQKPRF
ncbi:MAG: glycogen synthase GlgA [Succinivibrionaceae bacterium]